MLINSKEEIRDNIKKHFLDFSKKDLNQKSIIINEKILKLSNDSKNIFCFVWSLYEVYTIDLINKFLNLKKNIFVPKIIDDQIYPVKIEFTKELIKWNYWILEPKSFLIFSWEIDLAIVPWIAFTKSWKRIWKWKWFYDKFFSKNKNIFKIWICFDFQIIDDFDIEKHDILMDKVIYQ